MAMNDMLSLLRIAYYGLSWGGAIQAYAGPTDPIGSSAMPSRRRHVPQPRLVRVRAVVADGWSVHGCWTFRRGWQSPHRVADVAAAGRPTDRGFVVMDLPTYAVHRLFHAQRLWLMHSVHHSDAEVDVSTSIRHHRSGRDRRRSKAGAVPVARLPLWIAARTLLINPLSMAQHANIAYPAWVERPSAGCWSPREVCVHHLPEFRRPTPTTANAFPSGIGFSAHTGLRIRRERPALDWQSWPASPFSRFRACC
jgi:hypothetical protein